MITDVLFKRGILDPNHLPAITLVWDSGIQKHYPDSRDAIEQIFKEYVGSNNNIFELKTKLQTKIANQKEQIKNLEAKCEKLKNPLMDTLITSNEEWEIENQSLKKELQTLDSINEKLVDENKELKKEVAEIKHLYYNSPLTRSETEVFIPKIKKLEEENEQLKSKNIELSFTKSNGRVNYLNAKCDNLIEDNKRLEQILESQANYNLKLKAEIESWKLEYKTLHTILKESKTENEQLKAENKRMKETRENIGICLETSTMVHNILAKA